METLIAYFSQSGNTRKVAQRVQGALCCDLDEIEYDKQAHTVSSRLDPAEYDRVILMCPIWAFRLPEPMTLYLRQHRAKIKRYRLAATCGGFGLRGCVSGCVKILGAPPETATKIKARFIENGAYSIEDIVK